MNETTGQYNKSDGTPFNQPVPSAERTTLDFIAAINSTIKRQPPSNQRRRLSSFKRSVS
jgi:hypothetical protein